MFLKILILFLFLLGSILLMLKPLSYLLFLMVCVGVFVIVFYKFLKLKFFEYENSKQFISIKQSYLWKINPPVTPIEFPIDMLVRLSIRKELFTTYLILVIKSKELKTKKNYCGITRLNNKQIFELKQSLQTAKEYVKN